MTACGKTTNYNTDSDPSLCLKLVESAQKMDLPVRVGNTVGTDDFYEAQGTLLTFGSKFELFKRRACPENPDELCLGRLDGTFCTISEVDKMNWLEELRRDHSIINFEMEAPLFLSFTRRANIPAAVICAAMLNRLNGDQITTPKGKLRYLVGLRA